MRIGVYLIERGFFPVSSVVEVTKVASILAGDPHNF